MRPTNCIICGDKVERWHYLIKTEDDGAYVYCEEHYGDPFLIGLMRKKIGQISDTSTHINYETA